MDAATLAGLSVAEFQWLLQGLSEHSRFQRAWNEAAKHVYKPEDIAAITAAARR